MKWKTWLKLLENFKTKGFKSKYSSHGILKKKCEFCGKDIWIHWHGKMNFRFAEDCNSCDDCFKSACINKKGQRT